VNGVCSFFVPPPPPGLPATPCRGN
jgi:hypothetical protein